MSVFPEIDEFVENLRSHYHAIGRPDADEASDKYSAAVEGLYRASLNTPATMAHWDLMLRLYREQVSFAEKRDRTNAALDDFISKHSVGATRH